MRYFLNLTWLFSEVVIDGLRLNLSSTLLVKVLYAFCTIVISPDNQDKPKTIQQATHKRYHPRYDASASEPENNADT